MLIIWRTALKKNNLSNMYYNNYLFLFYNFVCQVHALPKSQPTIKLSDLQKQETYFEITEGY